MQPGKSESQQTLEEQGGTTPQTVGEYISVAFSSRVCGNLIRQPWQTSTAQKQKYVFCEIPLGLGTVWVELGTIWNFPITHFSTDT